MIIDCHLFLNLPQNKPPFIGVTYNYDASVYAAVPGTELLALKDPAIDLHLEVRESMLNITLYARGTQIIKYYKCEFEAAKLNDWLLAVREATTINFGHVIKTREGKFQIAKAAKTNRSFYLPIKRLLVINGRDKQVLSITTTYPLLKKVL